MLDLGNDSRQRKGSLLKGGGRQEMPSGVAGDPESWLFSFSRESDQSMQIRTSQLCDLAEMDIVMSCLQGPPA